MKHYSFYHFWLGLVLAFSTFLNLACEPEAKIHGKIIYTGPHKGLLAAGLFKKYPPINDADGPYNLFIVGDTTHAAQGVPYEIRQVENGKWYVGAFLDIDGDDPMDPEMIKINDDKTVIIDSDNDKLEGEVDVVLPPGTGRFQGQIHYSGPFTGYVMAGLFKNYPPLENDEGPYRTTLVGESDFVDGVMDYDIDFVSNGDWYVAAFMDIGSDDLLDPELIDFADDKAFTINSDIGQSVITTDVTLPGGQGKIFGDISYSGPEHGLLMAGLFKKYPPIDDEDGPFYTTLLEDADFSQGTVPYEINYVEDGEWYVAAFLDIGADDALDPEMIAFSSDDTPSLIAFDQGQESTRADIDLPNGESTIFGEISYSGPYQGLLMAGLFKKYPPVDDEDGPFHTTLLKDADFSQRPVPYEINFVEDGEWFVAAFLDIGEDDPLDPEMIAFSDDTALVIDHNNNDQNMVRADIELPSGTGTVRGEVTYTGPYEGLLMVALFKNYPPIDDDDGPFLTTLYKDADFSRGPVSFEIPFVEDGDWYVAAIFDVGADDPLNAEMVAFSSDKPVHIDATQNITSAQADIELPAGTATVMGTIYYTGPYTGLVMAALFKNYPPVNDDDGPFHTTIVGDSSFELQPMFYEIPYVENGDWFVAGILDIGADDPLNAEMVVFSSDTAKTIDATHQQLTEDIHLLNGTATIHGQLSYTGTARGVATMSLFTHFPPSTADDGPLYPNLVGKVDFADGPVDYTIPFVEPGTYIVAGSFDIDGDKPMEPEVMGTFAQNIVIESTTTEARADILLYTPCEAYCGYVVQVCGNLGVPQYPGNTPEQMMMSCMAYCSVAPGFDAGPFGTMLGNSSNCRLSFANAAAIMSDPAACMAAGPSGGGQCGSWCQNYCDNALSVCSAQNITGGTALFSDRTSCMTSCGQMPNQGMPGTTNGNSVQCRLSYLDAAAGDIASGSQVDTNCAHASPASTTCR